MATPPFARFEWMIAGRYLRARRRERAVSAIAGFSFLGIALGVATLIIVMSVMNGFRAELVKRILGVNAHVTAIPTGPSWDDPSEIAARLGAVPGVSRAAPMLEGQVLASGPAGATGALLRAYPLEDLRALPALAAPEAAFGDVRDVAEGVALGAGLATELGLRRGEAATLITPRGLSTPFGRSIRSRGYPVEYVFRFGMHEYDRVLVYMPLDRAQMFLNREGEIDGVEVMVDDPDAVDALIPALREAVGAPARFWTWKQANGGFLDALAIERNTMFVILTLIILVAALNIISGLIMLVKDKGRDIAVLRTMGLTRGAVLRVFFICGASIGVLGALAGVALGMLFVWNVDAIQGWVEAATGGSVWDPSVRVLSRVPADARIGDVLLTLSIALGLSFLATLYPAWRAARLDPVEALRYE